MRRVLFAVHGKEYLLTVLSKKMEDIDGSLEFGCCMWRRSLSLYIKFVLSRSVRERLIY